MTTTECKVINVVCSRFGLSTLRFKVGFNGKGTPLLINKWIVFFIYRYTKAPFEYIGGLIDINAKVCLDYIAEIGFNIRHESEYQENFDAMNVEIVKIYDNESN